MAKLTFTKTLNVILLGPPGAGKGTQALAIAASFGLRHLSTGNLIRHNIQAQTPLGRQAKEFYTRGEYAPDHLVVAMVKEELCARELEKGVVLDGFPRTVAQAEALDQTLADFCQQVDAVIEIRSDTEEIVQRTEGRRVCPRGHSYHLSKNPPRVAGQCNLDGLPLQQRVDDQPETIRKRISVYREQTQPLLNYYGKKHLLRKVDGSQSIEDVTGSIQGILSALDAE